MLMVQKPIPYAFGYTILVYAYGMYHMRMVKIRVWHKTLPHINYTLTVKETN